MSCPLPAPSSAFCICTDVHQRSSAMSSLPAQEYGCKKCLCRYLWRPVGRPGGTQASSPCLRYAWHMSSAACFAFISLAWLHTVFVHLWVYGAFISACLLFLNFCSSSFQAQAGHGR